MGYPTFTSNNPTFLPANSPQFPLNTQDDTGLTGLRLVRPLLKAYTSKALSKCNDITSFNNGATLTNSTTYPAWAGLARNFCVTGAWAIAGVVPVGGTNTIQLNVGSSAGASLLTSATFNANTLVANTLTPLPLLANTTSLGGYPQINPTLYFYSATGAPPQVYLAWNAGVQTTAAQNCAVYLELEYDDFV